MQFSDEERERINAEARENVRRRNANNPEPEVVLTDPLAKWKRDADARVAARAAAQAELAASRPTSPDWQQIDERIAQHITQALAALSEPLGELLAAQRADTLKAMREEVRDLKIEAAKLGSQVAELRAQLVIDRSHVIDLPATPLSWRN